MSNQEHVQRFASIPRQAVEDEDISDSVLRTLAVLASYNDKDGWCYPSYQTMADRRGLSRRTIIRHVKTLVEKGYIHKRTKKQEGKQTANRYHTVMDYFEEGGGSDTQMSPPSDTLNVTPPVTPKMSPKDYHVRKPNKNTDSDVPEKEEPVADNWLDELEENDNPDYMDALQAMAKHKTEVDTLDTSWMPPDVKEHLAEWQKKWWLDTALEYRREPSKRERKAWIKQARDGDWNLYPPEIVAKAYDYHKETGMAMKGPSSITYAFGEVTRKKDTNGNDDHWEVV